MTVWAGTRRWLALAGCAVALLAASAAGAEDAGEGADDRAADIDALEPAVDTSVPDTGAAEDVDAGLLAADVARERSGDAVMDRMDLGRTEITGNQELPKVLYIVPWQKADPGDLMGKPVNTLLEEVLAPVDRDEFLRSVTYYDELYGSGNE